MPHLLDPKQLKEAVKRLHEAHCSSEPPADSVSEENASPAASDDLERWAYHIRRLDGISSYLPHELPRNAQQEAYCCYLGKGSLSTLQLRRSASLRKCYILAGKRAWTSRSAA